MTSFQRRLSRASLRKNGHKPDSDRPQVTVVLEDGYLTLRPTKGWIYISNARAAAQQQIAMILDRFIMPKPKPAMVLQPVTASGVARLPVTASKAERLAAHKAKMARKYGVQA